MAREKRKMHEHGDLDVVTSAGFVEVRLLRKPTGRRPSLRRQRRPSVARAIGNWRWTRRLVGLLVITIGLIGPFLAPAQAVTAPSYPLSGFFISASTSDAANIAKLQSIKAVGGDTVITFGSLLKPAALSTSGEILSAGKVDSTYSDCRVAGVACIPALIGGARLGRVFTFTDGSRLGSRRTCSADRNIDNNGRLYALLLIPTDGNGCVSPNNLYDAIVIYSGTDTQIDPESSLAKAATTVNMHLYLGMPSPIKRTDLSWLPDMSYSGTLSKFTDRFMMYQAAVNNLPGLSGFYHQTEMPLSDSPSFGPILDLYGMQNAAIKRYLPGRAALVSPYIDARLGSAGSVTPAQAPIAVRNIAATANGVQLNIAIQDGMGTGKGGAFMGNEAGLSVDPYAAAAVGAGTWGSKYVAPTGAYFRAAAAGIVGSGAHLWANVEGMAPTDATLANGCNNSVRGQTTKQRLDRQIQQVGTATTKNISFMWDSYYTCSAGGKTLAQELAVNGGDPIISDSAINPASGEITVYGYNLAGASVTVRYLDVNQNTQQKIAALNSYDGQYGRNTNLEVGIAKATFRTGPLSVSPRSYYMLSVLNGDGHQNDGFYSKLA